MSFAFASNAEDLLITRTGDEYKGKLELLSDKEVNFIVKSGGLIGSRSTQKVFPTNEVYMIKSDKRGYTFFNRKRERVILPAHSTGKKADLIYLTDGGEIPAWNISLKDGVINYQKSPKQVRALSNNDTIPVQDVFMIKYNDGSKDIFTDITADLESEKKSAKGGEKKLKVIFYKILRGETLESIARKYEIAVEDLREWNEFPTSVKNDTKLTPGEQIMIQIETD
ncbi:MAG: LysM peptidoglycan-binding domain-containing protein [Muribaculaceae bacterium]|nr:LysM peptidoglycan-binding domain-containing protein [Muribaculaceae bacterium]